MTSQIGIELSVAACRIVEVDVPRSGAAGRALTRVRRYAVLPAAGPETSAAFRALRGRRAAVIVWGAPGDHRQVMVTAGRYDAMRAEATRSLAQAGVDTHRVLVDIARAPDAGYATATRRPVVVALASANAIRAALEPLVAAGIRVKTVGTPATALASLARLRRRLQPSGVHEHIEAYVALEEMSTCVAVMRSGTLVAAHELRWGFAHNGLRLRPAREVAARLAHDLAEFLAAIGGSATSLDQLTVCGGFPELRSVGALLTERLDIEVEPVDAPFGVDESQLTEAPEAFRERIAGLRMAWAVAVDTTAPLSLLHARDVGRTQAHLARAAVAAGVVAGVWLGWQAAQSPLIDADTLAVRVVASR